MFEQIFRRICSNDLSIHAENTIKEIDLSHSSITTDTVMLILERFPVLEELDVDSCESCENLDLADFAQFLSAWIQSQKSSPNSTYIGRKIALKNIIFNRLRRDRARVSDFTMFMIQQSLDEICIGHVVIE
jgi:hypothetical protein